MSAAAGTPTPTAINGAPPSMLSPTAIASFPVPPANGTTEIYANGIPHYTGETERETEKEKLIEEVRERER